MDAPHTAEPRLRQRVVACIRLICLDCSIRTVTNELLTDGFSRVETIEDLTGRTFMADHQCFDVLFFPGDLLSCFEEHALVRNSHIVLQVIIIILIASE